MRKNIKCLITTLLFTVTFGLTAHAAEITPTNQVLTTNANAEILASTDANAPVVVSKEALPDGAPVQVTGVTDNGFYQIELNGTYFVAKDGLDGGAGVSVSTVAPAGGKYTCVINEAADMALYNEKIAGLLFEQNQLKRADWTNDPVYIYMRDIMEAELARNPKAIFENDITWTGYHANLTQLGYNLVLDMMKAHPHLQQYDGSVTLDFPMNAIDDFYYDDGSREAELCIRIY